MLKMTNFQTIQKLAKDVGLDISYIRKMIKDKTLTAYKKDGYKRIYIDVNEFNSTIRPIDKIDKDINLDDFLI